MAAREGQPSRVCVLLRFAARCCTAFAGAHTAALATSWLLLATSISQHGTLLTFWELLGVETLLRFVVVLLPFAPLARPYRNLAASRRPNIRFY